MICYRDMTFCTNWKNCANAANGECHRPLTPEVQQAADKWWGSNNSKSTPISVIHYTKCHVPMGKIHGTVTGRS